MNPALLFLAAGLLAGLANTLFHLRYHHVPLYLDPRSVVGDPEAVPWPPRVWGLATLAVAGVLLVVGGFHPGLAAPFTLAALLGLRQHEVGTYGPEIVVRLGKYAPASACLLGWWVARTISLALGHPGAEADAHGWDAASGVFGGCYVLAGIAKLRESGWAWGRAENMSLMLAERGFGRWGSLRLWLAQQRPACGLIGATGLWIELGAVAFVYAPLRPAFAVGVVLFKLFTWVLFGYFEPEWVFTVIAIGLAAAA